MWVLFPLDCPGGLRGQVIEHAVDACHLMGDPVGDVLYDLTPKPTGTIEWE